MVDETEQNRTTHPGPGTRDRRKIEMLVWMRRRHFRSVGEDSRKTFRKRRLPKSGMPLMVPACGKYAGMHWLPPALVVPDSLPAESRLPKRYTLPYYGLGKVIWALYHRDPLNPAVSWDPSFGWNSAFPPTGDGWEYPTSDETFARLRLQGPNPWMLQRVDDGVRREDAPTAVFEQDYSRLFTGIVNDVCCRFVVRNDKFEVDSIDIGDETIRPGQPGWDNAKRLANGLDVRYVVFGRHLLDTHLLVGQAFALSAYGIAPWHPLRPFLDFFTYGTLEVNHIAYSALLTPSSYFLKAGFMSPEDVRILFENMIEDFDLEDWIVPHDVERRGLRAIPDHPYVQDASTVWPAFEAVVERHLNDIGLDDSAIAADIELQGWYLTLAKALPNTDVSRPLDRQRLSDLLAALLYNNVIHEICGDMSPILGSQDSADKAIVSMDAVRTGLTAGRTQDDLRPPMMDDVFLMDQASYVSRFNVGGNNMLDINAARFIDDPKLYKAVSDLQDTLRSLETQLAARNRERSVSFNRMMPHTWEASISF